MHGKMKGVQEMELHFSAHEVAGSDCTYNAAHEGRVWSGPSDYHHTFTGMLLFAGEAVLKG